MVIHKKAMDAVKDRRLELEKQDRSERVIDAGIDPDCAAVEKAEASRRTATGLVEEDV